MNMKPIQKKPSRKRAISKPRRGRPTRTRDDIRHMKNDGDRLREALKELGVSQNEASRKTGIPQGHISETISGNRPLFRRDTLSSFAKLGIPADYLLGFVDTLIPTGQVRAQRDLESDVAESVGREVENRVPREILRKQFDFRNWRFDGAAILSLAADREVEGLTAIAATAAEFAKQLRQELETSNTLWVAFGVTRKNEAAQLCRLEMIARKTAFARGLSAPGSAWVYRPPSRTK